MIPRSHKHLQSPPKGGRRRSHQQTNKHVVPSPSSRVTPTTVPFCSFLPPVQAGTVGASENAQPTKTAWCLNNPRNPWIPKMWIRSHTTRTRDFSKAQSAEWWRQVDLRSTPPNLPSPSCIQKEHPERLQPADSKEEVSLIWMKHVGPNKQISIRNSPHKSVQVHQVVLLQSCSHLLIVPCL